MTKTIQIAWLADHLDLVPTVAQWFHEEWSHLHPGGSVEKTEKRISGRLHRDQIPTIFIALQDRTPVGSAGLLEYDTSVDQTIERAHIADAARGQADLKWLETRIIPTPWLASVYVAPAYRRRGIATQLVRHNMQLAKRLGAETLYLYTETEGAEALYRSLGWQVVERLVYTDMHTTLMSVDLSSMND